MGSLKTKPAPVLQVFSGKKREPFNRSPILHWSRSEQGAILASCLLPLGPGITQPPPTYHPKPYTHTNTNPPPIYTLHPLMSAICLVVTDKVSVDFSDRQSKRGGKLQNNETLLWRFFFSSLLFLSSLTSSSSSSTGKGERCQVCDKWIAPHLRCDGVDDGKFVELDSLQIVWPT